MASSSENFEVNIQEEKWIKLPSDEELAKFQYNTLRMGDGSQRILLKEQLITMAQEKQNARVGQGSFGVVSVFEFEGLPKIAVKFLLSGALANAEKIKMETKVHILGRKCPDIVFFYGRVQLTNDLGLVLECMDADLTVLTNERKANAKAYYPESVLAGVAISITNALAFLSEHKVIHKDLKPANVLVKRDGSVKVTDFGVSGETQAYNSIAKTEGIGTKQYLAPERMIKNMRYSTKVDVWSLGLILYVMVIGQLPAHYQDGSGIVEKDAPVLLCTDYKGIYSLQLCTFVNACLIKDQKFRPRASELKRYEFYQAHHVQRKRAESAAAIAKELSKLVKPDGDGISTLRTEGEY